MNIKFLTANDISKLMDCSKTKAYGIIKELNSELEQPGLLTSKGRVNEQFFAKKFGFENI
ncbi:DNA-binding protein [Enterococcus faecium]|nr:DNA-binding protein [Enterococcus faecium]EME8208894.1 DNA-binding protein [Enterococcus faecium]